MILSTFGGTVISFLLASIAGGAILGVGNLIAREKVSRKYGESVWETRLIRVRKSTVVPMPLPEKLAA